MAFMGSRSGEAGDVLEQLFWLLGTGFLAVRTLVRSPTGRVLSLLLVCGLPNQPVDNKPLRPPGLCPGYQYPEESRQDTEGCRCLVCTCGEQVDLGTGVGALAHVADHIGPT